MFLVVGGELERVDRATYRDLSQLEFVGAFEDYTSAYNAWKARAQATVDNAHMRFIIVPVDLSGSYA